MFEEIVLLVAILQGRLLRSWSDMAPLPKVEDPNLKKDRLPQPYRMIDKVLAELLHGTFRCIEKLEQDKAWNAQWEYKQVNLCLPSPPSTWKQRQMHHFKHTEPLQNFPADDTLAMETQETTCWCVASDGECQEEEPHSCIRSSKEASATRLQGL